MEMLINLVIQLISGVVGGNAIGAALKDYNLGSLGNTIAGALGGVGGGQLLLAAMPAIAGAPAAASMSEPSSAKSSAVALAARSSRSSPGL
jgi:hypothetical protein